MATMARRGMRKTFVCTSLMFIQSHKYRNKTASVLNAVNFVHQSTSICL